MNKFIKALLICGFVLAAIAGLSRPNTSQSAAITGAELALYNSLQNKSDEYIGSDACKDCHEDQFKAFSHTSHAQLTKLASWKSKVTGCESCHGPGKAHAEEGDPKKIISFKNKSSKEVSESCLACHSGREEHNNFRRGEHWRNDIGCIDCHSPHSREEGRQLATS
ncbi:MAG TPA: multiheme c-type cytochrome, partial [Pyrinomonadaceae bacterium]|nr:multiheme c-type cytochrome [Pyrinomonadaceae bacterium]